jgi:hypothetical protein
MCRMCEFRLRTLRVANGLLACAFGLLSVSALVAQEPNCSEVAAIANMARANATDKITVAKRAAGNSYRAEVIFAARSYELRQQDKQAALALLNLLPQDDEQNAAWMTMGESLCDNESVADMSSIGRLGERLPRDLAKAVLLVPNKMPSYVSYASISVHDPHSDYALQMEAVCRADHADFVKAVEGQSTDERDWFVKHVLNPEGCHALALPESE